MSSIKYITLEEEMKKNPELKMSDVQILREWCGKQPHLPKIQDVQLVIFLHSNHYQIEPTKNTIENYFTIRTHVPEFFSNRDLLKVKELRKAFQTVAYLHLERKTKENYDIMMGRFLNFDPSHYDFNNGVKAGYMLCDELIWVHGSSPGFIYVADATGVSLGHMGRINPMSIKKLLYYLQNALPARLKAVHIINMSPVAEVIYNMFKPFIKAELIHLVHFHSSMENASKYFPIEALPNELGGKAGPIQELLNAEIKKMENFREWFLEDERINRVNESLRIGKSKTCNDLFGMDGTFRKLEID
ncbi:alpha-tocopherol transfer [Lasius niger]|uniref:Alpha-tocopherol transfer n=1 Tax=Lasius niger TaxID=67767 RepID=A0A0J7N4X3_LASNI|nr:alpha-tocopherol transfer [Lasius niger]